MKDNKQFRAAIHLSSTAVYTVVGYFINATGALKVIAIGEAQTDAFFGGQIRDRRKLLQAIEDSTKQAMDMAGLQLYDVGLSFATPQIASGSSYSHVNLTGGEHLTTSGRVIRADDVSHLLDSIEEAMEERRLALVQLQSHIMLVDKNIPNKIQTVENAIGHRGHTLTVYYHAIGVPMSYYQQMKELFKEKDFGIYPPLFAGVSAAEYALTEQEKKDGVCFVDIGEGTTNVCVYSNGLLLLSFCIDMGGHHLNQMIAKVFNVAIDEADFIKKDYGDADTSTNKRDNFKTLQRHGQSNHEIFFNVFELSEVIERFYQQLFHKIYELIESDEISQRIKFSMVLAGGGSQVKGLPILLGKQFRVMARYLTPNTRISACEQYLKEDADFAKVQACLKDYHKYHNVLGALLYQNSKQHLHNEELRYAQDGNPETGFFGKLLRLTENVKKFKEWM